MRKRNIARIMAVLFLLSVLVGCAEQASTQASTAGTTAPTETKPSKGSSLVVYDPDRTIYFLCQNSLDMYSSFPGYARFNFIILSKEALNLETIEVSVPTSQPYTVDKFETEIPRCTEDMQAGESKAMKFYIYEAYQGVDFYDQSSEQYEQDVANALENFKNLTTEDLPEFYRYGFLVMFDNTVPYSDEEITHLDITIDGQLYQPDIGSIRLHSEENHPFDFKVSNRTYGLVQLNCLYNDGLFSYSLFEEIIAEEDMTIKGLQFLGDNWEVLNLVVRGTVGGMNVNFTWDGKTPIELFAGDKITFAGVLYNPNLTGLFYQTLLQSVLIIERNGETEGYNYRQLVVLFPDNYELYAVIFDGIDMEPYYRGYYYEKNELWRKSYLEQLGN